MNASRDAALTRMAFATRTWPSSPRSHIRYTVAVQTRRALATSRTVRNSRRPGPEGPPPRDPPPVERVKKNLCEILRFLRQRWTPPPHPPPTVPQTYHHLPRPHHPLRPPPKPGVVGSSPAAPTVESPRIDSARWAGERLGRSSRRRPVEG